MKTMSEIKKSLGDEVATKKSLTAARRDIKRVPMSERSPERHGEMLRLLGEAGACKERVRVLQLAYAFARGRVYWTQERHSLYPVKKTIGYGAIAHRAGVSPEVIQEWVEAPVSAESKVAFEEHLLRAREAEYARRQAVRATRIAAWIAA